MMKDVRVGMSIGSDNGNGVLADDDEMNVRTARLRGLFCLTSPLLSSVDVDVDVVVDGNDDDGDGDNDDDDDNGDDDFNDDEILRLVIVVILNDIHTRTLVTNTTTTIVLNTDIIGNLYSC